MARQVSALKLVGTFGDVSFYNSRDGYMARMKGGVDGKRWRKDAAFANTRKNSDEFGRAGKGVKLMRQALLPLLDTVADPYMTGRLMKAMMQAVKADTVNAEGARNLLDGELTLLQGFDFNKHVALSDSLFLAPCTQIDRKAGTLEVSLPAFVPATHLAIPQGATHCRFISAGLAIDFEQETFSADRQRGVAFPLGGQQEDGFTLTHQVTADSAHPLFLAFGMEYLQEVNGQLYAMKGGVLCLVRVDVT